MPCLLAVKERLGFASSGDFWGKEPITICISSVGYVYFSCRPSRAQEDQVEQCSLCRKASSCSRHLLCCLWVLPLACGQMSSIWGIFWFLASCWAMNCSG